MQPIYTFWIENSGNITGTTEIALDPSQNYLIEGYLTKKNGGDYAHVFIYEVCQQSGDQVLCGVYDEGSTGIVDVLNNATSVTVGLTTGGGNHRAEGIVYQL
jgi:hypothetical protein